MVPHDLKRQTKALLKASDFLCVMIESQKQMDELLRGERTRIGVSDVLSSPQNKAVVVSKSSLQKNHSRKNYSFVLRNLIQKSFLFNFICSNHYYSIV